VIEKATREQTRILNRRLVLKTIYHHEQISRAQIARVTQLTRPTVSDRVAELMELGLVIEVGYGPSTGGKPPILVSVDKDALHLICIDLSRRDFRGAITNLRGEIIHRDHRPLPRMDGDLALSLVYDLLDALVAATDRPLLGIGVGTPGLIDAVNGVIVQAVNQDWRNIPLRRLLEDRYGVPVHLANDSQVAALGEYTFGDNDGVQNLVVISVGWGIGSGIVLNGQLLHGNPLGAGEIGHVSVVENGKLCRCGHFGCLETVAGAQAIVQEVRELVRNRAGTPLGSGAEQITFDKVCRMFHAGDIEVRQIIRTAGQGLGIAAANMIGTLGGCQIRLTGLLTCLGPFLLDVIREEVSQRTLAVLAEKTHVDFAGLGDDIIIRGAAAVLLTQELGVAQLPDHPL
jgi:N-acetylglucosamine repressor